MESSPCVRNQPARTCHLCDRSLSHPAHHDRRSPSSVQTSAIQSLCRNISASSCPRPMLWTRFRFCQPYATWSTKGPLRQFPLLRIWRASDGSDRRPHRDQGSSPRFRAMDASKLLPAPMPSRSCVRQIFRNRPAFIFLDRPRSFQTLTSSKKATEGRATRDQFDRPAPHPDVSSRRDEGNAVMSTLRYCRVRTRPERSKPLDQRKIQPFCHLTIQ